MVLQRLPVAGRRLLCHHNNINDAAKNMLNTALTGASSAEAGAACNKVPFHPINMLHSRVHTTNSAMHMTDHDQATSDDAALAGSTMPPRKALVTYLEFLRSNHPQLLKPAPVTKLLEQGRIAASAWTQQHESAIVQPVAVAAEVAPPKPAAKAPSKAKGRATAWNVFRKHQKDMAAKSGARAPSMTELSKLWKAMDDQEKSQYVELADCENIARS